MRMERQMEYGDACSPDVVTLAVADAIAVATALEMVVAAA